MKTNLLLSLLLLLVFASCQKKDIRELRSELDRQKAMIAQLQAAMNTANTDIKSLQVIAAALQKNISVKSYSATATGYLLTMSDGTVIELKNGTNGQNGKDGTNAPVVGVKQDTDGQYYWTLADNWLLQNGQKIKATGKDGQNGTNGVTPQLRVNSQTNYWEISYDGGNTWGLVKDKNGNSIPATGAPGQQGPAGISGFGITETADAVIITYNGTTYTLQKAVYKMVLVTTKALTDNFYLSINAEPADQADVWVDLNNDGKMDSDEKVNNFPSDQYYSLSSSQTVTVYGKVTRLGCRDILLTMLDVSKNTALRELYCQENKLITLDVSKNTALTNLYCYDNQLSALGVSKNTALTELLCDKNKLSSLDVTKNTALTQLVCSQNQLTTLDVTQNTKLNTLYCGVNQLSSLDVSKNTVLRSLICAYNKLTSLSLFTNTQLSTAVVQDNQIKNAEMTALINSLPQKNLNFEGRLYLFSGKPEVGFVEGNTLPSLVEIQQASAKKWMLFMYNNNGSEIQL